MAHLLSIENLEVSYGSILALRGISFEVQSGEIVSLIGANGAGKTTTLRALSGLLPSQGKIHFAGKDISQLPAHARVPLGLVQSPEGRGVFAQMTVHENLELGAYTQTNRTEIIRDFSKCYELFPRLKERQRQLAGTLSGGEQQMLAISRALMSRPKLLLLDEPSLGLAPMMITQIFKIIAELHRLGVTILLVEQNARMALRVSSRAYVLETGKIIMSGKGEELLNDDSIRRSYLGV